MEQLVQNAATPGRLTHELLGPPALPQRETAGAQPLNRRPALALSAEGPRRVDLVDWVNGNRAALAGVRLLAPAGIAHLLAAQTGLAAEALRAGTMGPAAAAALAAGGAIDAVVALRDPIELRPGDTTTRALCRLALFWDIPLASNRTTADLLLASLLAPDWVYAAPPGGPTG